MPREFIEFVGEMGDDCWDWEGELSHNGYGRYTYGYVGYSRQTQAAHRWAFQQFVRLLDDEESLDHLCENRRCVNPDHLEPVSVAENNRRAKAKLTECKHGHPLSGDNLYVTPNGRRNCKTCRREAVRRCLA